MHCGRLASHCRFAAATNCPSAAQYVARGVQTAAQPTQDSFASFLGNASAYFFDQSMPHLKLRAYGVYLDLTFGAGVYSRKMLQMCPTCTVFGVDRDPHSYEVGLELQKEFPGRFVPVFAKYSELPRKFSIMGIPMNYFNGAIMELGLSSLQYRHPERGFRMMTDGVLDMRLDHKSNKQQLTASQTLNLISEIDLVKVLRNYGHVKNPSKFARLIISSRQRFRGITTTKQLADTIAMSVMSENLYKTVNEMNHPARRVFLALRYLVNNELNEIDYGLEMAHYYLTPYSNLAVVTTSVTEDMVVKANINEEDAEATSALGIPLSTVRKTDFYTFSKPNPKWQESEKKPIKKWSPLIDVGYMSKWQTDLTHMGSMMRLRIAQKTNQRPVIKDS